MKGTPHKNEYYTEEESLQRKDIEEFWTDQLKRRRGNPNHIPLIQVMPANQKARIKFNDEQTIGKAYSEDTPLEQIPRTLIPYTPSINPLGVAPKQYLVDPDCPPCQGARGKCGTNPFNFVIDEHINKIICPVCGTIIDAEIKPYCEPEPEASETTTLYM